MQLWKRNIVEFDKIKFNFIKIQFNTKKLMYIFDT